MQLERFYEAKQAEVIALRDLAQRNALPDPYNGTRPDFLHALRTPLKGSNVAVIAEYKRASPSRGVIRENLEVEDVALQYAESGASALSILTEEKYFHGNLAFLSRVAQSLVSPVPLLRKDFIFDPLQVLATAATPASALLLIVRLTPDVQTLRSLREQAESFGIHAVVEVFDADDIHLARESGARIIQVNARDLQTLKVDRKACLDLAQRFPARNEEVWIAASGIQKHEHLHQAADVGFHAVLVGTALMEQTHPGEALAALLDG